jgi:hypothetical protein
MSDDETLERHVRSYYEAESLPPAAIGRLTEIIAEGGRAREVRSRRRASFRRRFAVAVAALLAIGLGTRILVERGRPGAADMRLAIASEAAREHNLRLDVEFAASDYPELRSRMSNLEFSPAEPESFRRGMKMRLIGGRYASLHGRPAVQMKLADPHGEICTLIEARPVDELAAITQLTQHQVDGVLVDVWREKGLVMVLARPIA